MLRGAPVNLFGIIKGLGLTMIQYPTGFEDNRQIYITPALGSAQSLRSGRYRLENWGRAQSCHGSIHAKTYRQR